MPVGARPVPRFVFSLPTFAAKHEALCIAANLGQLPIVERWPIHNDILRETARVALAEHLVLAGARRVVVSFLLPWRGLYGSLTSG